MGGNRQGLVTRRRVHCVAADRTPRARNTAAMVPKPFRHTDCGSSKLIQYCPRFAGSQGPDWVNGLARAGHGCRSAFTGCEPPFISWVNISAPAVSGYAAAQLTSQSTSISAACAKSASS